MRNRFGFAGAFGAVGPPAAGPQVGAAVPAHVRQVRFRGLLALRPSLDSLATAALHALRFGSSPSRSTITITFVVVVVDVVFDGDGDETRERIKTSLTRPLSS